MALVEAVRLGQAGSKSNAPPEALLTKGEALHEPIANVEEQAGDQFLNVTFSRGHVHVALRPLQPSGLIMWSYMWLISSKLE